VNKFLLHTIEGTGGNGDWEGGRATLDSKSFWPHFIVAKDRSGVAAHRPVHFDGRAGSRACKSPGNVGTIQVEIGGKAADPFTSKDVARRAGACALPGGAPACTRAIPNSAPRAFEGSNRAYGSSAPSRISSAAWASTAGLVGHQHAPGNDHWDPGAINANVLLVVNSADPNPGATTDPVQPMGGMNDPMPSDDHDAEDDNAPPCVANRVAGRCLPTSRCTGGKKASRNSPPNVSGCGHIADVNVQCCADEPRADGGNLGGASCTAFGVAGTCEATANCARVGRSSFAAAGAGHWLRVDSVARHSVLRRHQGPNRARVELVPAVRRPLVSARAWLAVGDLGQLGLCALQRPPLPRRRRHLHRRRQAGRRRRQRRGHWHHEGLVQRARAARSTPSLFTTRVARSRARRSTTAR
jgi:hypothetical protein